MASLMVVIDWLNTYLDISSVQDDQSINGLQVQACEDINNIALATDASISVFQKAKADLLLVHHGLYWKNLSPVIAGEMYQRVKYLLENKMSLYAAHLPLDKHPEVGNNVRLIEALGFTPQPIENSICYKADVNTSWDKLLNKATSLNKPSFTANFGPKDIEEVTVCTGMGTNMLFELKPNATFITGEFNHYGYHYALENKINVIALGHYFTETFGIKALGDKLKDKFKLNTEFIDLPTGL
ncbi:MAG: Nif3-like dinuclear metal center hexameric protein [Candidatus Altiarchaeota archaeon]|nr:Nif3-like dinuclear metal center hexameric protein [Candidatus Altiarchaeota archaeon]